MPEISVIVPTRNRKEKLRRNIDCLEEQTLHRDRYEIIVVDDGSQPPISLDEATTGRALRVVRRTHGERSAARNHGATVATGEVLVFIDDDMQVKPEFLEAHLVAQSEWPGALSVGPTPLPAAAVLTPFGRFRAALDQKAVPSRRGPVSQQNFCTAQNMSLRREAFLEVGGFLPDLVSSEDQDLALRHSARGGRIVFLPEACAVHDDDNLAIRSYCRRHEWGAEKMIPFCRRHPDWPDNRLRAEVNGPIRWGADSPRLLVRKSLKATLAWRPALETLFALTAGLEQWSPSSRILPSLYRLLLGIHLQRGFRRGNAAPEVERPCTASRS